MQGKTLTTEIAGQDIAGQDIDGQEKHPTLVEIKM